VREHGLLGDHDREPAHTVVDPLWPGGAVKEGACYLGEHLLSGVLLSGEERLLLVGEVLVEDVLADLRGGDDVRDGHLDVALGQRDVCGGVQDPLAAVARCDRRRHAPAPGG
jgi:hypothetical protein